MNMMTIDPDVFNAAKAYEKLEVEAIEAADTLRGFLDNLIKAANHNTQPPYAEFSILPLAFSKDSGGALRDFVLVHKNFENIYDSIEDTDSSPENQDEPDNMPANTNAAPGEETETAPENKLSEMQESDKTGNESNLAITDYNTIDFSFGVNKDEYHIMRACIHIRHDTKLLMQENDSSNITAQRILSSGSLKPADTVNTLANPLFTWIFQNLPESDRATFLQNCEEMGLNQPKSVFGFQKAASDSESAPQNDSSAKEQKGATNPAQEMARASRTSDRKTSRKTGARRSVAAESPIHDRSDKSPSSPSELTL